MIYVISDLHGYPLDKLIKLLNKANFNDNDFLYILGDVIDRNGDGGIEILKWLLFQSNIQLILGNHEAMLLSCKFLFEEITNESIAEFDKNKIELLYNYQSNGGDITLKSLSKLNKESPETVIDILDYLQDAPLYETVSTENNDFLLVHSGLSNFNKNKKISDYSADEILWTWPEINDTYYDDIITVFGHTPTSCYGKEYKNKIIKTKTWIDIDMGAADGKTEPVLLCLNNMKEYRN